MKKYAARFVTEDGVNFADAVMPLWLIKDDRVLSCREACVSLQPPTDTAPQRVYANAQRSSYERSEGYAALDATTPVVLPNLYATETAALQALAERHMQKALEFTRQATKVGGGK